MELKLRDKTVIVTGGSSNIGRATALALAAEGSNVVVADIDETQGQKVVDKIEAAGGKGLCLKCDVTSYESAEQTVARVLKKYGRIDILVNNAGWVVDRLFVEKPRAEWEKEIAINLWGVINCTRAVIGHMIDQKKGKIVNIGSDAGRAGEYKEVVYSACKGGVIAMSKSLAKEVGRYGINVNVVCPGFTPPEPSDTGDMSLWRKGEMAAMLSPEIREKAAKGYPLKRLGTAQDIANTVVFLASDCAEFITGQTLSVTGGYTMM